MHGALAADCVRQSLDTPRFSPEEIARAAKAAHDAGYTVFEVLPGGTLRFETAPGRRRRTAKLDKTEAQAARLAGIGKARPD
jgi:hypothetical protein